MEQKIIIGVVIAISVAVMIAAKIWLHKLVKFKMDESAVLKFFDDSGAECEFHSTETIASSTKIATERVMLVCANSKSISSRSGEKESWCLR